jgi:hypothetical protein
MYDITITGSLIDASEYDIDAKIKAACHSLTFAGRIVRVHDVDGETVIAEYRNGDLLHVD